MIKEYVIACCMTGYDSNLNETKFIKYLDHRVTGWTTSLEDAYVFNDVTNANIVYDRCKDTICSHKYGIVKDTIGIYEIEIDRPDALEFKGGLNKLKIY